MNWVKEQLMKLFAPKYIGSITRTFFGWLSGVLAAHGASAGQIEIFNQAGAEIMTSVLIYTITQLWSLDQKNRQ